MLVVRGRRAIRSPPIYEVSKVEDGMPSPDEKYEEDTDSMAQAIIYENHLFSIKMSGPVCVQISL